MSTDRRRSFLERVFGGWDGYIRKNLPMVRQEDFGSVSDRLKSAMRRPFRIITLSLWFGVATIIGKYVEQFFLAGLTGAGQKVIFAAIVSAIWMPAYMLQMWQFRKVTWRTAHEHGYAICLRCGYDLRDIESQRCPECGSMNETESSLSE